MINFIIFAALLILGVWRLAYLSIVETPEKNPFLQHIAREAQEL
jgi:hypothetical protein